MRKKCIVCGEKLFDTPIYICKNMPQVSQNLPTYEELNNDKSIDLNLCQCSGCGLVQFDCEPVEYYKDSTRAGERCDVLVELRKKQYKYLIDNYNLKNKKIIEIGAGKGGFLKTLKEMSEYGIHEYGIENNKEFVEIARKQGVNVNMGFIDCSDMILEGAPFDAFVSFAYPARLIDPNVMLKCISNNLVEGGIGLVQVPSFEHLLEADGFYDITRDHIAYYSEDTLRFLLQKNGFDVLEHGKVSKIYIYAIVKKRTVYDMNSVWSNVDILNNRISMFVKENVDNNKKIAVWCAGHFAFTVLSTAQIGDNIEYIIDNAKFKQGCYSPGSHVKIVSAEYFKNNPVDIILILGPIYIDEIVNEIRQKCSYNVEIVTIDKNGIKTGL